MNNRRKSLTSTPTHEENEEETEFVETFAIDDPTREQEIGSLFLREPRKINVFIDPSCGPYKGDTTVINEVTYVVVSRKVRSNYIDEDGNLIGDVAEVWLKEVF